MRASRATTVLAAAGLAAGASIAPAQVRIGQWNITNFDGSTANLNARKAAFKTSLYGSNPANGAQFAPDLLITEEIDESTSFGFQAAVNAFRDLLNEAHFEATGQTGDWAAVPYVTNQGDSGNALFYRTSKFDVVGPTVTLGVLNTDVGGGSSQSPRDNQRWLLRLKGYAGADAQLYVYGAHMKAGSATTDQQRRLPEALRIRNDANALPAGTNFLLGGDFNIQSSSQTAYQYLVAYGAGFPAGDPRLGPAGQFFDPINKSGNWNASCSFRNIHTQEPNPASSAGGMDDRHDQILISGSLRDGQGLSYIPATPGGNILAPFIDPIPGCSTSTNPNPSPTSTRWEDPNHSYRCWGNDGNHFNLGIDEGGFNTQVGAAIAAALRTTTNGNGHLPVYLDLQVPAKLGAPSGTVNLGSITQGTPTTYTLQVTNAANVALFSKGGGGWGVDALSYALALQPGQGYSIAGATTGLERPATAAPAQANTHVITLDTSTPGTKTATLTISSDDPDSPSRVITLTATVTSSGPPQPPPGAYDVNGDGVANVEDLYRWFALFTDVNQNGVSDGADLAALRAYLRWYETDDVTAGRR